MTIFNLLRRDELGITEIELSAIVAAAIIGLISQPTATEIPAALYKRPE